MKVEVEEKPDIAIVDSEELGRVFRDALGHAAKVEQGMCGRAESLGLVLDGEFSSSDS